MHRQELIKRKPNSIFGLFYLIATILTLISIIAHLLNGADVPQYILGIFFCTFLVPCKNIRRYFNNFSILLIIGLMMVRYCVMPVSFYLCESLGMKYLLGRHLEYTFQALFIMIYEMAAVLFVLNKLCPKYLSYESNKLEVGKSYLGLGSLILIGLLLYVFVAFPQFFSTLFVFSFEQNEGVSTDSSVNGLYVIIYRVGIIVFYSVLMQRLARTKRAFIVSAILTIITIWVASRSLSGKISRTTMLVNGLSLIMVLAKIYPNRRKAILQAGLFSVVFLILTGTMIRFAYSTSGGLFASLLNTVENILGYGVLCSYFSGFENVTTGLACLETFQDKIGLSTLFNDLTYSIPYIGSRFIDVSNITPLYFNLEYHGFVGNISQIIPTVVQGKAYFGYLLCPVFSVIRVVLSLYADKRRKATTDTLEYYAWCMAVYMSGAFIMYSVDIFVSHLTNRIFPILLVVIANRVHLVVNRPNERKLTN